MLKKTTSLVLTFSRTAQAMAADKCLSDQGLPGRLIPVPNQLTAGCGLAWAAPPEAKETLCAALEANGVGWSGAYILDI